MRRQDGDRRSRTRSRIYSRKPGVLSFIGFVPSRRSPAGDPGLARRGPRPWSGARGGGPDLRRAVAVPVLRHLDVAPTEPRPPSRSCGRGPGRRAGAAGRASRWDVAGRGGADAGSDREEPAPGAGSPGDAGRRRRGGGARIVVRQTPPPRTPLGPGRPAASSWRRQSAASHDGVVMGATTAPREVPVEHAAPARCPTGQLLGALRRPSAGSRTTRARSPPAAASSRSAARASTGASFIPQAVERGAQAVVARAARSAARRGRGAGSWCRACRRALPWLGGRLLRPSLARSAVVGITGTNGRRRRRRISARRSSGPRSRHGRRRHDPVRRGRAAARDAGQTTPEAIELQGLLAEMVAAGSAGSPWRCPRTRIALHRVDAVAFDVSRVHEPHPRTTSTSTASM